MDKFPYRTITKEDRDNSFEELRNISRSKLGLTNKYNLCSDYYFQKYRLSTKKGKWSNVSAWNDKEERQKIIETYKRVNKTDDILAAPLRRLIRLWYGCVGQFRPDVAVYVYQKFGSKSILDFSAGWGDRLISAMSQGIDYIGIDSNSKLSVPYSKMIKDFRHKTVSNVKMIFKPSEDVDFSKFKYDLVFTSPPYFNVESYEGMKKYKDNEFIDVFFKPVVKKAWDNLQMGGVMALNIPKKMYEILKPIYGASMKIKMPLHNRFYNNNKKNYEYIYYWKKQDRRL
jgi:hypothetical protein